MQCPNCGSVIQAGDSWYEREWCTETRPVTMGEWAGAAIITTLGVGLPLLSSRIRKILAGNLSGYERIVTVCGKCTYVIPGFADVNLRLDPPWKSAPGGMEILSGRFMRVFGGMPQAGDIIYYQILHEDPRTTRNTLCYQLSEMLDKQ